MVSKLKKTSPVKDKKSIKDLSDKANIASDKGKKTVSPQITQLMNALVNKINKDNLPDPTKMVRAKSDLLLPKQQRDNLFTSISGTRGVSFQINSRDLEVKNLEYRFDEIGKIEDLESLVTRAFGRKKELALKQGFNFVGKNKKTLTFMKSRISEIEDNSKEVFHDILKQVVSDLVSRHNAFILKHRGKSVDSQSSKYKINGKKYDPIVRLSCIPPELVKYVWNNKTMQVEGWIVEGYDYIVDPNDMIHFHISRKTGFVAGTPSIVSAIQDILSLRRTEQDIEIYIHLFVFPIIVYMLAEQSDSDAGETDYDGNTAIANAAAVLSQMINNGGAVLPPGDEIKIEQSTASIDYKTFLMHLKNRVYTGLGVSSVDMGEGDSANKATAETLSTVIVDSVKSIQKTIQNKVNHEFFRDIMREYRGLKEREFLDEKNVVELHFNEIDLYYLIKYENHTSVMFSQNLITLTEARKRIGHDPLSETEKKELYANLFELNTGADGLAKSKTSPSNQHSQPSDASLSKFQNEALRAFVTSFLLTGESPTGDDIMAFKKAQKDYYKKHIPKTCSNEVMNVKIEVAKSYFAKLASSLIAERQGN